MPLKSSTGTLRSSKEGKRETDGFVRAQKEELTCPLHSTHLEVLEDA
jgi:hypothetical protein